MDTQNTLNSIPIDLFNEIFSRLPIKSVGICRCVSKIFASNLGSEDFKQLFLTRSLTRPRLLFAVYQDNNDQVLYSSPHPQTPYEKSSVGVKVDFFAEFPRLRPFSYAYGLFHFPYMRIATAKAKGVICNLSTGQYVILPKLETTDMWPCRSFLVFDRIDKKFKIFLTRSNGVNNERSQFILTLGTGKMRWRKIICPSLHDYPYINSDKICINGVLYYLAQDIGRRSDVIVCFDVRTETFKFKPIVIDKQREITRRLINYKGKLGITVFRKGFGTVELDMLVLEEEDVEKPEWLKYTFPSTIKIKFGMYVDVVGMNSTDDIVLSISTFELFNVYYINLKKNSFQSVEVQGFKNHGTIQVIMDHVEDLFVNDAKYFKSNNHANLREVLSLSDEKDDD